MASRSRKSKNQFAFVDEINHQPIRLNVTLSEAKQIAFQRMVAKFFVKRFLVCKLIDNFQEWSNVNAPFDNSFEISFELCSSFTRLNCAVRLIVSIGHQILEQLVDIGKRLRGNFSIGN